MTEGARSTAIPVRPASLRRRVLMLFALIAVVTSAVIAGGLWYASARIAEPAALEGVALAGAVAIATVCGLCTWVWLRFDEGAVRPLNAVARAMETLAHSGATGDLERTDTSNLGALGSAVSTLAGALGEARADLATARAEAAAAAEAQKAELEAILRDLDEAVFVCTRSHRILLLNRRAVELIGDAGEVGLGRRLTAVVSQAPFDHAIERLERAHARGDALATTSAVCTVAGSKRMFHARVGLIPGQGEDAPARGYVATFRDVTAEISIHTERDRLLTQAIDAARRASANISVAIDVARSGKDLAPDDRRALADSIAAEAEQLGRRAASFDAARERLTSITWPMDDVTTEDLFESVALRCSGAKPATEGEEQWLRCDSLSIAALLSWVCGRLAEAGIGEIRLRAVVEDGRGFIELLWKGETTSIRALEDWLSEPLADAPGQPTGREVLDHHGTDLWPDRTPNDRARLRMPLEITATGGPRTRVPQRPEFYDFGIGDQPLAGDWSDRPLGALSYVVFDTETTGLEPARGDQLVQVAGVRIVNGRVLEGERFDMYVNPGRPIPPASTRIHGITDGMVADAPAAGLVLDRFSGFSADAVLVAHNAAFDMAFLRRDGAAGAFDNPVLDTVLLSAYLHDHTGAHTLDDLAARVDVDIASEVRHTAIGDALATAKVFVRLLPLLEARGVRTLGDAIRVSGQMHQIRAAQASYG